MKNIGVKETGTAKSMAIITKEIVMETIMVIIANS
jgi:hypothetical protein